MITLKCYEPAGKVISLSAEDICRHVLASGATGSGKTTGLINPLLRQLLAWKADRRELTAGLLVLDAKGDDTIQKITGYARAAGREGDLMVLSETGNAYYDFFGGFRDLSQVDEFTNRVLFATRDLGDQNAYWTESRFGLVQCALVLLLASGPFTFDEAADFLRTFCYERDSKAVEQRVRFVERLLQDGSLRPVTRRRLELSVVEARNWKALDDRTRELHRSTLGNALRPLLSPAARDLFDSSRGVRFNPGNVLAGKILVCSLSAISNPQLTLLLFRALKRDYYTAVLSRMACNPHADRLCGIILDELPLAVTADDCETLPVLRSKGGFMVAATQSLSALDDVIGRRKREALLANFCSYFFFGGRENQTDEFAMLTLGLSHEDRKPSPNNPNGSIQVMESAQAWNPRPLCPPGALARLKQHEVYAKLANGDLTHEPCWLEPDFHDFSPAVTTVAPSDLAEAVTRLQMADAEQELPSAGPPLLVKFMHQRGHKLMVTPSVITATWQLCVPSIGRAELIRRITWKYPARGLETLPSCWLLGLLHWLEKRPRMAPHVTEVSHRGGILWAKLDAAASAWGEGPVAIPAEINRFIYPSLWRPILRNHFMQLLCERPDLRSLLMTLPQIAMAEARFL